MDKIKYSEEIQKQINEYQKDYDIQKAKFKKYTEEFINTEEGQFYYINIINIEFKKLIYAFAQLKTSKEIKEN